MGEALALNKDQNEFTQQQMAALRALGVEDATPGDLMLFLNTAQRTGLDPFSKQIYMIGRRQKVNGQWVTKQTIQAGIDGLRLVARRAADKAGVTLSMDDTLWADKDGRWHDLWIWPQPPTAAKVTIHRGDGTFSAVAPYVEYVGTRYDKDTGRNVPNSMWASKPATMLAKCAEALALRRAFPLDLAQVYTPDEMGHVDNAQPPAKPSGHVIADALRRQRQATPPQPQQQPPQQPQQDARARRMREMAGMFATQGVSKWDGAAPIVSDIIGRTVTRDDELTEQDIDKVIAWLQANQQKDNDNKKEETK